ncbi:MAG: hypothetical protein PVI78_08480 [Anaerolineales bacterium]
MKKRAFILALVVALIVVVPAAAGRGDLVGERLSILGGGSMDFPAGEAFHIFHGWAGVPVGMAGFSLYLDGAPISPEFRRIDPAAGGIPAVRWGYNFPDGLTGEHEFIGIWELRCTYAVRSDTIPGPCSSPNAIVPAYWFITEVEFTE